MDTFPIITISRTVEAIHVEFVAASENSFAIQIAPAVEDERVIADILRVVQPLMRYDVTLAQAGDGDLSAALLPADKFVIDQFVARYHRAFVNIQTDTLPIRASAPAA